MKTYNLNNFRLITAIPGFIIRGQNLSTAISSASASHNNTKQ